VNIAARLRARGVRASQRLFYRSIARVMAAPASDWTAHVLPHGPIEELAPGLWHVTGSVPPRGLLPREMVLYRLPDATLLLHSAIALDPLGMARLEALGRPAILVVPNRAHRIDAGAYKARYPALKVTCPAAVRPFVEEVVPVDAVAEEVLPRQGIACHEPRGIGFAELAYELPLADGSALVLTDLLAHMDGAYRRAHVSPPKRLALALDRVPPSLGVTLLYRFLFLEDASAFEEWLEELADALPALRVICVAHGSPIRGDGAPALREAARRVARR
jgi:hypothetical protein